MTDEQIIAAALEEAKTKDINGDMVKIIAIIAVAVVKAMLRRPVNEDWS